MMEIYGKRGYGDAVPMPLAGTLSMHPSSLCGGLKQPIMANSVCRQASYTTGKTASLICALA